MITSQLEIVKSLLQTVWSDGNIDDSDKFIASHYTIRHDPGDPWEGKTVDLAGYKERCRLSRAPFPDQKFEIVDITRGDEFVVVTWNWSGTHRGDLPGIPATGKVIRMSGATVYYFSGDRITGHWQIADRLSVYRQIRDVRA